MGELGPGLPPPALSGSPLQPEEVEEVTGVVPPTCSAASQKCPTSISPEIPRRPLKGADTSAVGELQVSAVTSKDSARTASLCQSNKNRQSMVDKRQH